MISFIVIKYSFLSLLTIREKTLVSKESSEHIASGYAKMHKMQVWVGAKLKKKERKNIESYLTLRSS